MNQVPNEQKDHVLKTLAIVGFVAVVIFGVWLAVQIVGLMPQAFNSLASIADGVYNYQGTPEELVVTAETDTILTNDAFQVSWTDMQEAGVYTFSYACRDGVSVDVMTETGDTTVPCGETVVLGDELTTTMVTIASERVRSADIDYSIAFIPEGETESLALANTTVTVTNPEIPTRDELASEDETPTPKTDAAEPTVAGEATSEPTPPTPTVTATTPTSPQFLETVTYETPVSNPAGFTDLAVRIVAVGHLTDSGNFVQRANMDDDARGAFQFEVKNIGTKTSDEWDFIADLTGGTEYNAPLQTPLKPQERVVFTLGYDNVGEDGIRQIGVQVRGGDDRNGSNNSFTWAVSVVE